MAWYEYNCDHLLSSRSIAVVDLSRSESSFGGSCGVKTLAWPDVQIVVSRPRFGCLEVPRGAYWCLLVPTGAYCGLSKYMVTCF
jgi:hypothetical protein